MNNTSADRASANNRTANGTSAGSATKQPWWKNAVVYQIYPRSFQDSNGDGVGDLRGIIHRIPYIARLGVNLIWICPIYASPQDDNGYDISDYQNIDPAYGTLADMDELIAAANARGIGVLLDLVVNHTSDEHPWFLESRSSRNNPKRDWYIWKDAVDGGPPTNWPSHFGGGTWEWDAVTSQYYFHAFSRRQPDLNWENPRVRRAVYDMMHWWLDRGIAGFRVDAITMVKKNQAWPRNLSLSDGALSILEGACSNEPGILDFLREMRDEVLKPRGAITVAEAPGVPLSGMDDFMGETNGVFNMIFTFDHMDLDLRFNQPWNVFPWTLSSWKAKLTDWQRALGRTGWTGLYLENHDQVRSVSKFGDPGRYRVESAKCLATWFFLMRGTPFIYQGQELGMTNAPFTDISDYRDVSAMGVWKDARAAGMSDADVLDYLAVRGRDHARTPVPWNGSSGAGFSTRPPWIGLHPAYPTVNVETAESDPGSVFHHYRALVALRLSESACAEGDFTELWAESNRIGGYRRSLGQRAVVVVCNFTGEAVRLDEPLRGSILVSSSGGFDGENLAPWQSVVLLETGS